MKVEKAGKEAPPGQELSKDHQRHSMYMHVYIYKLVKSIPQFKLTHPALFHQTFYQSIPFYHKIKILISTFQIFNQSQKDEHPDLNILVYFKNNL